MKIPPFFALLGLLALVPITYAEPTAYPLTTCVVSGDKLGAMGKPVILNEQGTEVRFCCRECVESFKQDPAKHLAKLKTSTSNP